MKTGILKLEDGINRNDQTVTDITVMSPTAGQMRGLAYTDVVRLDIDTLAELLPRCTQPSLTREEVMAFTFGDMRSVSEVLNGFFVK